MRRKNMETNNEDIVSEANINISNEEDIKIISTNESEVLDKEIVMEKNEILEEIVSEEKEVLAEMVSEEDKIISTEENKCEENDGSFHRNYLTVKEKGKKRIKVIIVALIIFFVNLFILLGIICVINRLNINVYKNVYVFGEDISNFSSEQVVDFLNKKESTINETSKIVVYQEENDIFSIDAEDIDFNIDIQKTSDKIIAFGRKDNFIIDNLNILKALLFKNEIEPEYIYTEEKLDNVIKNIELTIKDRFSDDSYSLDEIKKTLIVAKGKTGNSINNEIIKTDILSILKELKVTNYNINLITKSPNSINIEELYDVVKREPEDAYIDTSTTPPDFVNEKDGYDLNVESLKEVLSKEENKIEGISIEFPLTILEPKVKLTDITYTLYNDKLAGYTTYFDATQKARANNLGIALKYLNGTIVMPGKTFSYYNRIGETTYAKGYQDAATFKAGTVVYEVGGGICQTSSTLYNVALMANLEVTERHQHGLPVGYVPPSRDATVYGNILDFKFKNTRNYPVKIVTSFSETGNMNISLYGTKEKKEYEVILSSKVLYNIPYTTRYTYDQNIDTGVTSVISKGVNGYASEGYITKKLNGEVVSSMLLSKDIYKSQQAVVKVGIKAVVNGNVDIY